MTMTRRVMLENAASIYDLMTRGWRDKKIAEHLALDSEEYDACKRFLLEQKAEKVRNQPREHYFVEYESQQRHNIRDLDSLIKNLDANSQYNALVGAIRLRSDILDKIVDRAQEFGLVKKEANKHEVVGGVIIAQLDAAGLRKQIIDTTRELSGLMGKYGEKDFAALPAPATLHYGPTVETTGESADDDEDEDLDADDPAPKAKPKPSKKFAAVVKKVLSARRDVAVKTAR
jgi:hypothetical protein